MKIESWKSKVENRRSAKSKREAPSSFPAIPAKGNCGLPHAIFVERVCDASRKGASVTVPKMSISQFLASCAIPICSPNSTIITTELLHLPDLNLCFTLFQGLFTPFPSSLAMWRRYGDQNTFFPNWANTQSVNHGDSSKSMSLLHVLCNREHGFQSTRYVRGILQLGDRLAVEIVTRGS